jgi:uncharacterized integral membrane protein (TIGR00698 family)
MVSLLPSPHWCLLVGLTLTLIFRLPEKVQRNSKIWSSKILQFSIVCLGAGLNFRVVLEEGPLSILMTFFSISLIMLLGFFLAKGLKVSHPISTLIASGTAICGGSAISAIGPVIQADQFSMALSLSIVFILNALSLVLFPLLGVFFELNDYQYGAWAALAIHDTSAVVAAAGLRSEVALDIATTLKLTRALWIMPLTLFFCLSYRNYKKISIPWFILLFLIASIIFTFNQFLDGLVPMLKFLARTGLSASLFMIGLSLKKDDLNNIQLRPIFFGILLWIMTLSGSLIFIKFFH